MTNQRSTDEGRFALKLSRLTDDAGRLIPPSDIALYRAIKEGVAVHSAEVAAIETRQTAKRTEIEDMLAELCVLGGVAFNPKRPFDAFRDRSADETLSDELLTIDYPFTETGQ